MSTGNRYHGVSLRTLLWALLAVGGWLIWLKFAVGDDSPRAWRALLVNFIFFTSLAGGLAVWPAIVRACNGSWHTGIERLAAAGIGFSVPSLLALLVLWIGSPHWSPWYISRFHQGIWLDNSFIFARDGLALLLFWGAAVHYTARRKGNGMVAGGILIALYALVFSLLGMDLVMALDPHWFSTLAGGYFFISGLYIAITCWTFMAVWRPEAQPGHLHDLGRLVVAFSLMTTYFMYAHLLPIWYEALPHEVRFVAPRMNFQPWKSVSMALLAVVYLGPLVLLLMERAKRSRWWLGGVSFLILAGMWVERWWLVVPTFEKELMLGAEELATAAAFAGFLGLGMELFERYVPRTAVGEEKP
ncbi:hypothetical protein [Geobacter sp. DSM 9736]|uniref:hypothetical protein n=1 Tax=Geobacter sp. DSM 9736 TaxID=1277350 RepID=UPI000B4FFD08|nr:hypothetical protein [Geobacter sp. DSM 9736]SNB46688.1 hypothetical protein SAMN06269301_2158 [Geobacter sp. DSM 9736]